MSFNFKQINYIEFRETLKQRTNQVILWIGAGLSVPNVPTWKPLKSNLIAAAEQHLRTLNNEAQLKLNPYLELAKSEDINWRIFSHLREVFGLASYNAAMRHEFRGVSSIRMPDVYKSIWKLNISGCITLNIDRFPISGYTQSGRTQNIQEFSGATASNYLDVLKGATPFVANLHGSLEDPNSWIFTQDEFDKLQQNVGYQKFVETCFISKVIAFMGISADDPGATLHLEKLKSLGLSFGGHYWFTNRNDYETQKWAEKIGLQCIFYQAQNGDHGELLEAIEDLERYTPKDAIPLPITPDIPKRRNQEMLPPEEVEVLKPNEIRYQLNQYAVQILAKSDPDKFSEYETFLASYEEAIYRSWSANENPTRNHFFEYILEEQIAKGAFGKVFKAKDKDNNLVAIKILHENIREEKEMLQSFRRGVQAMQILSSRRVERMVPYLHAWEIPAATVMEFIDGPDLENAVVSGYLEHWSDILSVAIQIANTVHAAHLLPERVLHRDIRPHNIMLKDYYVEKDISNVVLLDFDLSWHRDASGLSVSLDRAGHGYAAPEQVDPSRKAQSRNALVDSFGLGMTLFFMLSRQHPVFAQHLHRDWEDTLKGQAVRMRCKAWRSLPKRYTRLISYITKDHQGSRWDMTTICNQILEMISCLNIDIRNISLDCLCEEIFNLVPSTSVDYIADVDTQCYHSLLKTGFKISIRPKYESRSLLLQIEWINTGEGKYKIVSKNLAKAKTKIPSLLKKSDWSKVDVEIKTGYFNLSAQLSQANIKTYEVITSASKALESSINYLRFD